MGTHGAVAITYRDGRHRCWERTLDGYVIPGDLRDWIDSGAEVTKVEDTAHKMMSEASFVETDQIEEEDKPLIPNTGVAFGDEHLYTDRREHEQEYYVHFNLQTHTIGVDGDTFSSVAQDPVEVLKIWNKVQEAGWSLKWEVDCDHVMEEENE